MENLESAVERISGSTEISQKIADALNKVDNAYDKYELVRLRGSLNVVGQNIHFHSDSASTLISARQPYKNQYVFFIQRNPGEQYEAQVSFSLTSPWEADGFLRVRGALQDGGEAVFVGYFQDQKNS